MLSKYNVPLTFCTVVITILLSGCDTQPAVSSDAPAAASTTMEALRPINTGTPATLFTSLASDQTGIDASCQLDLTHPMKRLYHSGFVCGGIAIGDLDGDNRPDIFFANGPDKNRLFFQKAPLQFEEYVPETPESSIDGGENWAAGVTLADVDNDRDLDIYVCNYDRPNQLFLNEGNRKFREAAAEAGLDLVDACLNPAFCDYDRDGDLDVYVLTNRYYRDGGRPRKPPVGYINRVPYVLPEYSKYYALTKKPNGGYDIDNAGRGDYFLTNNGDGTFTDAREQVQSVGKGHGLSVTWWDYNHDGWPDVYVGNDFNDPDYLLHNNGDGTFSNALKQVIPHTSWFSMGADFGDDGRDERREDGTSRRSAAANHEKCVVRKQRNQPLPRRRRTCRLGGLGLDLGDQTCGLRQRRAKRCLYYEWHGSQLYPFGQYDST